MYKNNNESFDFYLGSFERCDYWILLVLKTSKMQSSSDRGHCVVFLDGTVNSCTTSLYTALSLGSCTGGIPVVAQQPIQAWGSRNTPVCLILLKQEIRATKLK